MKKKINSGYSVPATKMFRRCLEYIDYFTVMGWFVPKAGCNYDTESEVEVGHWKNKEPCMSTMRATLPPKMKRLINPNNKTLCLSDEDNSNLVKVLQALVKRFGGSVSVQAERSKIGRMFQNNFLGGVPSSRAC